MKIRPLQDRVMVRRVKEEEKTRGGLFIPDTAKEKPVEAIVQKVREGSGSFGYNAATNQYGDLVAMGVIDPAKVVRSALQNAASVAGLMLTTEALIAERPKDEAGASAHAGHGHGDF